MVGSPIFGNSHILQKKDVIESIEPYHKYIGALVICLLLYYFVGALYYKYSIIYPPNPGQNLLSSL